MRTLRYSGDTLTISQDGKDSAYRLNSVGDRTFFAKSEPGRIYPVLYCVSPDGCTCQGFTRWKKCKHVAAIRKLREIGKL